MFRSDPSRSIPPTFFSRLFELTFHRLFASILLLHAAPGCGVGMLSTDSGTSPDDAASVDETQNDDEEQSNDSTDDSGEQNVDDSPEGDDGDEENNNDSNEGDEDTTTHPVLPVVRGPCPDFSTLSADEGRDLSFSVGDDESRLARIWFDPQRAEPGPVVFHFKGSGAVDPSSVQPMGDATLNAIVEMGGMVINLHPDANRPSSVGVRLWYLVTGNAENDLLLMDEIVACAAQSPGIDSRHIHSMGFSAGALQSSRASIRRPYIASIVSYSGGIYDGDPAMRDDYSGFAALIYHGDPDVVVIDFAVTGLLFAETVNEAGGYALRCIHDLGHSPIGGQSNRLNSWQFMLDHPYGATSPYEGQAIPSFPVGSCTRP